MRSTQNSQLFHSAKYRLHAEKIVWFAFAAWISKKMKSAAQIVFQQKQYCGVLWKTTKKLSSFGAPRRKETLCRIPHQSCKN